MYMKARGGSSIDLCLCCQTSGKLRSWLVGSLASPKTKPRCPASARLQPLAVWSTTEGDEQASVSEWLLN